MKRIIFMDIDGTLCDAAGNVPDSARVAIHAAQKKGHQFYVCTGRSKPELIDSILSLGFDGIIGAGGGYIEIAGKVIEHKKMPENAVLAIIDYFKKNNIGYYLESNDGLFGSDNCIEAIKGQVVSEIAPDSADYQEKISEFQWFYDLLIASQTDNIDYSNVNKISFISQGHSFSAVANTFGDEFELHHSTVPQFGPESGEIAVKGVDKKTAIQTVLRYLNNTGEQTMAYGDGNNDIAMFGAVNYAVAMANATDKLKAIANEITAIAEEDGIMMSFIRNRLIDEPLISKCE